uniref:cDNA FLJ35776 fis, clone TESTI2005326 n=1 Tax=Homo sapiens TaxID=9606 RepID=Q8NA74_HUMAN
MSCHQSPLVFDVGQCRQHDLAGQILIYHSLTPAGPLGRPPDVPHSPHLASPTGSRQRTVGGTCDTALFLCSCFSSSFFSLLVTLFFFTLSPHKTRNFVILLIFLYSVCLHTDGYLRASELSLPPSIIS